MPTLSSENQPLVLVTGANGHAASHIIHALLEANYRVRGTVRSEASLALVSKPFAKFGDALDVVRIPDLTVPGAFDEALRGVNAVFHVASPLAFSYDSVNAAIKPAVQGTLNALESAKSHAGIKRVILCSSEIAFHPPAANVTTPTVYSEEDRNDLSPQIVKEHGDKTDFMNIYATSKVMADQAAWKFYEENKSSISWDLVSMHPTTILGPVLYEVKTPEHLNASNLLLWKVITGQMPPIEDWNWIDVRDFAQLYVRALQTPEAGGQRIITTHEPLDFQELLDHANAMSPQIYPNLPKRVQGGGVAKESVYKVQFNVEKARRILGLGITYKLRSKEEMLRDTLENFKAHGFEL